MEPVDCSMKFIPFDYYCQSVQSLLKRKMCEECCVYFATIKSLTAHNQIKHKKNKKSVMDIKKISEACDDLDEQSFASDLREEETTIPIVDNIEDWLKNPWTEF